MVGIIRLRGEAHSKGSVLGLTVGIRLGAEPGCQLPSHHHESKVCGGGKRKLGALWCEKQLHTYNGPGEARAACGSSGRTLE